jgi:hypothetical protein
MNYYRLEGNSAIMTAYVDAINQCQKPLLTGSLINEKPEKLPYVFTYYDEAGNPLPDLFQGDNIMSKKMFKVFTDCGVDNIQTFPTIFINKETGEERDDYVVFNIIGLVSCAKLDESEGVPLGGGYYFTGLVIDPDAAHELPVFRVKESLMDIIVNEEIAKKLEEEEIHGIILTPA